jgi:hypothetical protein
MGGRGDGIEDANETLVRVLNTRGVGFITYTNEHNAEFAKEAMAHQCKFWSIVI